MAAGGGQLGQDVLLKCSAVDKFGAVLWVLDRWERLVREGLCQALGDVMIVQVSRLQSVVGPLFLKGQRLVALGVQEVCILKALSGGQLDMSLMSLNSCCSSLALE